MFLPVAHLPFHQTFWYTPKISLLWLLKSFTKYPHEGLQWNLSWFSRPHWICQATQVPRWSKLLLPGQSFTQTFSASNLLSASHLILLQLHMASADLVLHSKHLLWKPGGGPLLHPKPTHPLWRHILKSSIAFAHFLEAINALPLIWRFVIRLEKRVDYL